MRRLDLIGRKALALSDSERATLAAHLLDSLSAVLSEDDEGVAEANRRDLDLENGNVKGISWDTLRQTIGR